jgi:DNA-binding transcriptional LysR family regulator
VPRVAAKQLGVSEPTLSRSLKQLEAELGVRLFDRQGVTPTLFGEIVLKYGERVATELDELMREVALAKGLEIGELRIAAAPYPSPAIASAIPCQIERELKEGLFTVLPVEASWLKANYGFITKRGRAPSPALIAFMVIVRRIEKEIPP